MPILSRRSASDHTMRMIHYINPGSVLHNAHAAPQYKKRTDAHCPVRATYFKKLVENGKTNKSTREKLEDMNKFMEELRTSRK